MQKKMPLPLPQKDFVRSDSSALLKEQLSHLLFKLATEPNYMCEEIVPQIVQMGNPVVPDLAQLLNVSEEEFYSYLAQNSETLTNAQSAEPFFAVEKGLWRSYVAQSLGKIGDERAVEPLFAALSQTSPDVRLSAMAALVDIGNLDHRRLSQMLMDNNTNTQCAAAYMLGEVGDAEIIETLIQTYPNVNSNVQGYILSALGKFKDSRALPFLIHVLQKGEEQELRYIAADALGNFDDLRAIPVLEEALNDPSENVRKFASLALTHLRK